MSQNLGFYLRQTHGVWNMPVIEKQEKFVSQFHNNIHVSRKQITGNYKINMYLWARADRSMYNFRQPRFLFVKNMMARQTWQKCGHNNRKSAIERCYNCQESEHFVYPTVTSRLLHNATFCLMCGHNISLEYLSIF